MSPTAGKSFDISAERQRGTRQRLLRGGIWVVAGRGSGIGLALLAHMVLARYLSQADYGMFILFAGIVTVGGIAARVGLDRTILRYVSESSARGDGLAARQAVRIGFSIAMCGTLAVALLFALFLESVGQTMFDLGRVRMFTLFATLGLSLTAIIQLASESLRAYHEFRFASLFQIQSSGGPLINLCFIVLFVAGASAFGSSIELALGSFVIAAVVLIPVVLYLLWRTGTDLSEAAPAVAPALVASPGVLTMLGVGLPIMISQLAAYGVTQGGIFIAGPYCTPTELAGFGAATRLSLLVALPLYMTCMTVVSSIPELHEQRRLVELGQILQSTTTLATGVALLLSLLLLTMPATCLGLLFGPAYQQAAPLLMILCFGQLVVSWTGPCGLALIVTGYHNLELLVNLIMGVVLVVAGSIAAAASGATGLAIVCSGTLVVGNLLKWALARRFLGIWTHASFRLPASLRHHVDKAHAEPTDLNGDELRRIESPI